YSLVRFVACCLVLIVPTTLMGGTFPIISRFYVRAFSRFTSNVSLLYGLNTAGAVAGVVLAGFFLIEMFGIYRTSLLAVAVNLTVGLCAVALQGRVGATPPEEAPDAANEYELDASQPGQRRYRRVILGAVFLSGVSSLAYEVIWTRTLVFVLDSFVYSFSIMLATFLTGIAVGSFILSAIAPKIRRGHLILCVLFVLIGLTSLATFPFFAELTTWKKTFAMKLSENIGFDDPAPWGKYVMFKFLIASLIMAGPTLLMGAAFPLALRLYTTTMRGMGRKIGVVYASNTIGAILGSFLAGFVLIPFLGMRNTLVAAAGISVLTGAGLLAARGLRSSLRRITAAATVTAVFVAAVIALPDDIYQRVFQKALKDFELVYYDEDPTATVTAHKRGERVIININGLNVAGTGFDFLTTQKMQAHMAMLLHPGVKRVLQVGFGSGGTCYSVAQHDNVDIIDCVELCEGVIKAAGYFLPSNHNVLQDPRVQLTIEDARNYILATPHKYDLILSDSVHPTYAGNGTLYSKDYFALCKKKLNPGGYVSFWLPTYLLSTTDYKTIIKTFQSEFPYVMVWYVNNSIEAYTIVIGKADPIEIDVARLRDKLDQPKVRDDLAQIDVLDVTDILSYFVMGPETAAAFARDGGINSDDHPVIEFRAPRSMSRRRTWFSNLRALAETRESPERYIVNAAETASGDDVFAAEFAPVFSAVGMIIQGQLTNIISYDFGTELNFYNRAEELWPDSRAVRRLKALATSRVMILRAEESMQRGNREEASEFFARAIEVNPDPYDDSVGHAYFRMAYISWTRKNLRKALQEVNSCLHVFPNHKNALMLKSVLALNANDYFIAERAYQRLERLFPRDADVKKLRDQIDKAKQ
ncbi:MAG: fused MFS/spermidine synthase, partial [Candidatus Krumholzibacteria bacterium]|nr:fused MFS/spermidine synthase [Candidatus Krumholzibacteria bacterium]